MDNFNKAIDKIMKISVQNQADKELLGKQYDRLTEYMNKTNEHRASLNTFYNSLSAGMVTVITFTFNTQIGMNYKYLLTAAICFLGAMISITWMRELRRFYRVAQVIDLIVAKMESHMPSNPFETRVKMLATIPAPARVEKQEQMIPTVLLLGFTFTALAMLYLVI